MTDSGYECVDPSIGEHLPLLDHADLDAERRQELLDHLSVCDACRLRRALIDQVSRGVADGRLLRDRGGRPPSSRVSTIFAAAGALATAAGLALILWLPPVARDAGMLVRADETGGFQRPVEGEVVGSGGITLAWHPVDGATSYRIVVEAVNGEARWEGRRERSPVTVPSAANLPANTPLRARLETTPRDLMPPGGWSVDFQTGAPTAILKQRLVHGALVGRIAVGGGLVLLALALFLVWRTARRRLPTVVG